MLWTIQYKNEQMENKSTDSKQKSISNSKTNKINGKWENTPTKWTQFLYITPFL